MEVKKGSAVVVDGSRAGRESSCDGNSRNTNSSCSSSSTSSDSGVTGGSVVVGDSGSVGGSGSVCGGLFYRGGLPRLIIKGPVEGPASSSNSSSRVAARVHPSWGTGARGVGPSAPSGPGGCSAADGVRGRNVAVGATTRNCQPMGANLTKQSRVSSSFQGPTRVRGFWNESPRQCAVTAICREDRRFLRTEKNSSEYFLGISNLREGCRYFKSIFSNFYVCELIIFSFFDIHNLKQFVCIEF